MIRTLVGPEGAGKTIVMTAICNDHCQLGGELWAFPGYKLYDENGVKGGKILSREISLEEFLAEVDNLDNKLLAIDEMQNFFDSYYTLSKLTEIMVLVEAQRRKSNVGIIGCIREFEWLPKRLRQLTHELGTCWDLFWTYRNSERKVSRGTKIAVRWIDLIGFRNGRPGQFAKPLVLDARKMWNRYETMTKHSIWEKYTRVQVQKRNILVNPSGNGSGCADFELNDGAISDYATEHPAYSWGELMASFVKKLKDEGITRIPSKEFYQLAQKSGIKASPTFLGRYLPSEVRRTGYAATIFNLGSP